MATAGTQTVRVSSASPTDRTGFKAGFISRTIAFVVDIAIILVVVGVTYLFVEGTLTLMRIDISTCTRLVPIAGWRTLAANLCRFSRIILSVIYFSMGPLYFVLLWLFAGRTIGMGITGLRVVRTNGKGLRISAALLRLLGYVICVLTLGLGFLWALFDKDRQGLHDKIAGTYVIYWTGVVKHVHPPPAVAIGGAAQQVTSIFSGVQGSKPEMATTAQPPMPEP